MRTFDLCQCNSLAASATVESAFLAAREFPMRNALLAIAATIFAWTMSGYRTGKILIRELLGFLPWNVRQGGWKRCKDSHPKAGRLGRLGRLNWTGNRQRRRIPGRPSHGNNRRAARDRGPRSRRHTSMGKSDALRASNVTREDACNCHLRRDIAKLVAAAQCAFTATLVQDRGERGHSDCDFA
jgi:hypothetical protein